jgi:anti-anti-sigma factor
MLAPISSGCGHGRMQASAFETEVASVPGIPDAMTVRIKGTVRYPDVPALRKRVLDEISISAADKIVLELGAVQEMDTSGAAVLVEALLAGREQNKRILLCSPSESVLRLFRLAGFEEALKACCPTPQETRRRLLE